MTSTDLVQRLLADQTHHIEFNGHLTNHAKHAVIALAGLGASPQRISAYYDGYAKLTPYGYGLEGPKASRHAICDANWQDFLGQRTSFSAYCEFFDRREKDIGLGELLRRYVPRLFPGWVGAFTHAVIHLGWALDARSRWMIIEGLAYMVFSYDSCQPDRWAPVPAAASDEPAAVSLLRVAGVWEDDGDALGTWVRNITDDTVPDNVAGVHPELLRSGLQYRIARLVSVGHPLMYQTGGWIDRTGIEDVWQELYYVAALLYLAEPGDFVLLHLITSLHGMEQVARWLPPPDAKEVARCFWIGMFAIVFSGAHFPAKAKLAALHATFRDAFDSGGHDYPNRDWKHIVARALVEDEEHNPKLVYVLRRIWQRSGQRAIYRAAASQFTRTPELPGSFDEPPVSAPEQ